jgi:hypothetical protein
MLKNLEKIHEDKDFEKSIVPENKLLIFLGYDNGTIGGNPTIRAKNNANVFFNLVSSSVLPDNPDKSDSSSSGSSSSDSSSSDSSSSDSSSSDSSSSGTEKENYIYYGYINIEDNGDNVYDEYYVSNITLEKVEQALTNGTLKKINANIFTNAEEMENGVKYSITIPEDNDNSYVLFVLVPQKLNYVVKKLELDEEIDFSGYIDEEKNEPLFTPANGDIFLLQNENFNLYGETWYENYGVTFDILIKKQTTQTTEEQQ